MSEAKLNPKKELFLEYLFNDAEYMGNTLLAAKAAGYTSVEHAPLVRSLKDEIVKRTQEKLAFSAPKAAIKLIDMLEEDGSTPKGELRLKAAESLLDRIGVAKKQELDVNMEASSPLFFIPAKKDMEEQVNGEEGNVE